MPGKARVGCMLIMLTAGLTLAQNDVMVRVSYEGSINYLINITFSSRMFTEFYKCLCGGRATCKARYGNSNLAVQDINSEGSSTNNQSPCLLYGCSNNGQSSSLNCTSMNYQPSSCTQPVQPRSLSMDNVAQCSTTCVGLVFTLKEEYVKINSLNSGVKNCSKDCCSDVSTLLPPISTSTITTSTSNLSSTSVSILEHEENYLETIIISVVTGSVLFIVVITFIIIILIIKCQARRAKPEHHVGTRRRSDNLTDFNPEVTHNASKNNSEFNKEILFRQDPLNPGRDYAYSVALPISGQEKGKDEWPNSVSKITGNSGKAYVTRSSSDVEGEYAVIDDSHIRSSSSGHDGTDGFRAPDNTDYCNIKGSTTSSKNDDAEDGLGEVAIPENQQLAQRDEKSGHHLQLPSNSGQSSVYNVAKPVTHDKMQENASAVQKNLPVVSNMDESRDSAVENQEHWSKIYYDLEPVDEDWE